MSMSFDANGSPVEGPHPATLPPPSAEKWSGVKSMVKGFNVLGTDPFPYHLCAVRDPREADVRLSTDADYHVVVLVDSRFPCRGFFARARPYTAWDEDGGKTLCGWLDADGNVYDHGERDIHGDHAKVVAWKPCPKDFDLRA